MLRQVLVFIKFNSLYNVGKDFMKAALTLLVLIGIFMAIALGFADQFGVFGEFIANEFGLVGLLGLIAVLDFLPQPFPPDIPVYSFILTGAFWAKVALFSGLASVFGACLGYWTGWFLQEEGVLKFISKKKYKEAHELYMKYGFWAVLIGALTPVPFNVISWSAGVLKMPFQKFLFSALVTRVPRFFIVGLIAIYLT